MGVVTVGHGPLDHDGLEALLGGAGVDRVVDVRRYPGSRRNPDVARDALALSLPAAGVEYRWEPRLGGRRHLTKDEDAHSPDQWWRVAAFRAYAGYTRTAEYRAGLADLVADAEEATVAIMCSESVWWRCHRRLVADTLVLTAELPVQHLMPDGRLTSHEPSAGARVAGPHEVVWDLA